MGLIGQTASTVPVEPVEIHQTMNMAVEVSEGLRSLLGRVERFEAQIYGAMPRAVSEAKNENAPSGFVGSIKRELKSQISILSELHSLMERLEKFA